ncbi:serine O-acetyltransferase [Legionella dresdenensis]|uniref:Serine O-acetyltransferase n=1 Tax=Legionella dresdenensis TaxID=450200 RepID=A0ABV8CCB5_9GAMM
MNAIKLYRLGRMFYKRKIPFFPTLIRNCMFLLYNSYIPVSAEIGEGTVFAYGAIGVVLHSDSKIGRNCVIGQGVTIGAKEGYFSKEVNPAPVIGDNCYIAAGAKILGDIKIGNNCIIAAGATVLSSAPDNSVLVGSPAKIVKSTEMDYLAIR